MIPSSPPWAGAVTNFKLQLSRGTFPTNAQSSHPTHFPVEQSWCCRLTYGTVVCWPLEKMAQAPLSTCIVLHIYFPVTRDSCNFLISADLGGVLFISWGPPRLLNKSYRHVYNCANWFAQVNTKWRIQQWWKWDDAEWSWKQWHTLCFEWEWISICNRTHYILL